MTFTEIPRALRRLVRARAKSHCEYCQTSEWLSGLPCEIDHIIPRAKEGPTTADNLCLACASSNGYKGTHTRAIDRESGEEVSLFNPRHQHWREHFAWSEDGTTITGLTASGRATVVTLKLNHPLIVAARSIWVNVGLHPPQD
jgi:hypothetical protein